MSGRHTRRRRVVARALEDVGRIDARQADAHEHLARTGCRVGPLLKLDDLVSAGACEDDCLHTLIAFPTAVE